MEEVRRLRRKSTAGQTAAAGTANSAVAGGLNPALPYNGKKSQVNGYGRGCFG